MGQSNAGSVSIFSQRTKQTQGARVYSHNGPIKRREREYILTMDQANAGSASLFSRWANQTQGA
eukprot:1038840-Prorocentrum_minimum.AAC.1